MAKKPRVVVGMSGGVDSSVVAALLKKRGYDVIGMTLQLLARDSEQASACCNLAAVHDAKRICSRLKIPHYSVNLRETFSEEIISYFVSSYQKGLTPNPCIECNRKIKFTHLYQKARELDAPFVATGHYVQITKSRKIPGLRLNVAKDLGKDQSYFLYMLTESQLQHVMFPLGGYQKHQVRALAHRFGLVNADKPDSSDICFVAGKSYKDFLDEHIDLSDRKPGFIVDFSGKVLGSHSGLYGYTVGQRKGLGISSKTPLFVYKLDIASNTLVVGPADAVSHQTVTLDNLSMVNPREPLLDRTFLLKTRYQMMPVLAKVTSTETQSMSLTLKAPQAFLSPGQSGVLYDGKRVVGGGIII